MKSLTEIAQVLETGECKHLPISYFCIDSRLVVPGSCFFALKGEKADGHHFLAEVAEKGAHAAVVEKTYLGPNYGLELLYVEDVVEAMHTLAKATMTKKNCKVVGITGSVGKTTTKEYIHHLLCKKFRCFKPNRSYNSQRTLPLVVLNAPGDEEILILEMSMTEKGHIKKLTEIAAPEIVVLTPISLHHVDHFDNVDQIAEAKSEILTPKCEYAVIHQMSIKYKAVQEALKCENVIYPSKISLESPVEEPHFTENFIAAYEVAKHLGMTDYEIAKRSTGLKTIEHRFEKKTINGTLFIDDAYNGSIHSTEVALTSLPEPKVGGRRIAVLSNMGELGPYSEISHRHIGKLAAKSVDEIFCIGDETKHYVEAFQKVGKKATLFHDMKSLKFHVKKEVAEGDVVLVKGVNTKQMWKIIDFIEESS